MLAAFFIVAFACSRIFEIWALRFGFVGVGGGGVVLGRERRVRCRVLSEIRALVRLSSLGSVGAEMALDCGSMVRGRRVNVWSIVVAVVGGERGEEGFLGDGDRD